MRIRIPALGAGLLAAISLSLAGCDSNGTNAGLTNGPPPSAPEQTGVRNDLPGAITNGDSAAARDTTTRTNEGGAGDTKP